MLKILNIKYIQQNPRANEFPLLGSYRQTVFFMLKRNFIFIKWLYLFKNFKKYNNNYIFLFLFCFYFKHSICSML